MTMLGETLATSQPAETDGTEESEIGIEDLGDDDDDDLGEDAVDGEAVVVPGQRPGPTDIPG